MIYSIPYHKREISPPRPAAVSYYINNMQMRIRTHLSERYLRCQPRELIDRINDDFK